MTRFIYPLLLMLLCAFPLPAREVKDVPNVQLADSTRFVSDPDGILSTATVSALDATLGHLRRSSTAEMAVALVENMPEGTDIDTYATELFEAWGVGKKDNDNGLLLVVARGDRKAAIRTGYGMEGVVPDVIAGRVLRNRMFPAFREGDFDGGVAAAVDELARIITDPKYAAELKSDQPNVRRSDPNSEQVWSTVLWLMGLVSVGFLAYAILVCFTSRKMHTVERYEKLSATCLQAAVVAALTLGMALPALLLLLWMRRRVRNRTRICSNCGSKMHKLNEADDNFYLTPAQDTEEKINSVDYDVWLCDTCKQTEVLPYRNRSSQYTPCPYCGAQACRLISDRIAINPTTRTPGQGVKTYSCQNCGKNHNVAYSIAKLASAAPIIIGGGGGFGSGGGFSGGSFGGGSTGGGGASGGW